MNLHDSLNERCKWIRKSPMANLEENESPVWENASQVADTVEAMGAEILRYPAIRWAVHSFKASKYLPKYPGLGDRDLLGEIMEEMARRGLNVIPYCHIGVLHTYAYKLHPEWAARNYIGQPFRWNDVHFTVCLHNDSFIEAMIGAVREVVSQYNPPAVYFDGPGDYSPCFCHHCQEKFQRRFGYRLPQQLSWEDGTQVDYIRMRCDRKTEIIRMLNETIKSEKNIPVLFNTGMRHLEYAPELTIKYAEGAQTAEVMRPLSYWNVLENVRLGASLKKISLCYLPPGPYESLATFSSLDIPIFGSTYVMHGGTPWAQRVECFLFDRTAAKTMKNFFDHLKNNSEVYYEAEPVKEIGLIYSRQTGYYYAKENRFEKLDSTFSGAFRSLIHGHRHFDCFYDTQLDWDRIKDYRALFLPNVACLSDTHIDLLKRFVMEGGGLVATYETSLFDERGCRRDDFGLSELFGVSYSCGPLKDHYRRREYRQAGPKMGYSLIPEAYFKWNVENPIAKDMNLNHLIPVSDAVVLQQERRPPEYVVTKSNDKAGIVADLFLPAGGAYGKPFDFPLGNPPGVVMHRFGKGQVVYFAAPLEKHYLRRGLPELRQLLINAVDFVCGGKPLLKIEAPSGVVANLTSVPGRYYLHLINYCGTMHESSYPVEWIAPIKEIPIQLLLEPKITIKSVKMLNEGLTLDFQHLESYLKFIVPHLGIFDTVIIEYA